MKRTLRGFSLLFIIAFIAGNVRADVKLPALISDGMVLQQGMVVPLWGWADDGESVTVEFQNQKVTATGKDGKWMLRLKPLKAGGPFTLTVSGRNRIELKNVLVGEVWICGGQSNTWAKYPTCNLYNKEGLPATPFRTDDWPGITQTKATQ